MNSKKYCKKCEEELVDRIPACPLQCSSPKCKAYQRKPKIDFTKKPIVWVLGGPGSGKGTQCTKIANTFGFTHLSTGDLLREEVKKGGDRAKCLETAMENGTLVPTDVVLSLVLEAMEAEAEKSKGFLIDGYPREKHQGIAFEKAIGPASLIIYFEASQGTLTERLLKRAVTSGRPDDNKETIQRRLATFYENNNKVLEQYPDKITRINAEAIPESIFAEVQTALNAMLNPPEQSKKEN